MGLRFTLLLLQRRPLLSQVTELCAPEWPKRGYGSEKGGCPSIVAPFEANAHSGSSLALIVALCLEVFRTVSTSAPCVLRYILTGELLTATLNLEPVRVIK